MSKSAYQALGFVAWKGGKWYLKRKAGKQTSKSVPKAVPTTLKFGLGPGVSALIALAVLKKALHSSGDGDE